MKGHNMRRIAFLSSIFFVLWVVTCRAEGLDTLIDVSKSMGDIQKEYNEETKNFDRVKRAVDSGSIKKGQNKDEILKQYGEPVVMTKDSSSKKEKWVYKPATSSFFDGIRIYLFFNDDGALDEIKVVK